MLNILAKNLLYQHRKIPNLAADIFVLRSVIQLNSQSEQIHQTRNLYTLNRGYMVRSRKHSTSPTYKSSDSLDFASSIKSIKSIKSLSMSAPGGRMRVIPIRALQDNYMYLLVDETTKAAAAVDPVNASAMANMIHDQGVDLKYILTTHHHHDHAHGNADMLSMYQEVDVLGGDSRIQAITRSVANGENLRLGNLNIECLSTPCHTKGHICYYVTCDGDTTSSNQESPVSTPSNAVQDNNSPERAVFTGDTLFVAGCGRFFEGNSEQMDHSLNTVLGNLPADTRVFCGHEYTIANLKFALTVEPLNQDIKNKLSWAMQRVSKKEPTVPSTIGDEKKINPFMRLKRSQVRKFTGESDDYEVMTVLRQRKNEFKP